jgi:hypothetical protein
LDDRDGATALVVKPWVEWFFSVGRIDRPAPALGRLVSGRAFDPGYFRPADRNA